MRLGEEPVTDLLIIQKPLSAHHKGGVKMTPTGYPAVCLEDWLANGLTVQGQIIEFDPMACEIADQLP